MVSALAATGILLVIAVNTFLVVFLTRFFRIRMRTSWGAAAYAVVFVPVVLTASTIVLSGVFGIGANVGRQGAIFLAFVVPLVLGFSLDFFWLPSPEEVELPDTTDESDPESG